MSWKIGLLVILTLAVAFGASGCQPLVVEKVVERTVIVKETVVVEKIVTPANRPGVDLLSPRNGATVSGWSVWLSWEGTELEGGQYYEVRLAPYGCQGGTSVQQAEGYHMAAGAAL